MRFNVITNYYCSYNRAVFIEVAKWEFVCLYYQLIQLPNSLHSLSCNTQFQFCKVESRYRTWAIYRVRPNKPVGAPAPSCPKNAAALACCIRSSNLETQTSSASDGFFPRATSLGSSASPRCTTRMSETNMFI